MKSVLFIKEILLFSFYGRHNRQSIPFSPQIRHHFMRHIHYIIHSHIKFRKNIIFFIFFLIHAEIRVHGNLETADQHRCYNCKGKEHTVAITDAMEAAGMPDGKYQLGGQDVFVKEGAARLADGTLAGSTLTMIRAFQNLIRFGASPEDAALMTTRTPARSIQNEEVGEIELGAPAIFSRFDKDYQFIGTIG